MAPQNKKTSSSGFVYELNNFTACVNTADAPHEFNNLSKFLGPCNLSYAMIAAPILFCEVVEEVWSTAMYNLTDKIITFSLKGNLYSINGDVLSSCLNLPNNTHAQSPIEIEIKTMLNEINYVVPDTNLCKIVMKNLRKEWSYFFEILIKVLSGKISNFDAITSVIQEITYEILYNHFYNVGETIIIEMMTKLGNIESRSKKYLLC